MVFVVEYLDGEHSGHSSKAPMLVSWPKGISAGTETAELSAFWDWMPTFAELAGVKLPEEWPIDGMSLVPLLTGNTAKQKHHEYLYWEFTEGKPRKALRKGKWKVI